MRVDFTTTGVNQAAKTKADEAGRGSRAGASGLSQVSDQASFSFDRTRVQALVAQALQAPELRKEKVDALRQALTKGSYVVDAKQVADAISGELNAQPAC